MTEKGWKKLGIFSQMDDIQGQVLFLDLDIIIRSNIDCLFEADGEFRIIKDWDFPKDIIGNSSVFRFEVSILDSNVFNRKDVFDRYLKAAQSGAPTKRAMIAALGMTPNAANNGLLLENSILEWDTKWTPLKSSFTQSSDSEVGRPASDVVDEGGEVSREREDR